MKNTFYFDISEFAKKANVNARQAIKKVSFDLLSGIVKGTPVDKGVARASWQVNIGVSASNFIDKEGGTREGASAKAITKGENVLKGYKDATKSVYITSHVPYIVRLEEGWSNQAPTGMVKVALASTKARMKALLEVLKK